MHSNLVAGVADQITLYKADRAGKTQLAEIDPAELRQVADDMMAYPDFGVILTNLLALNIPRLTTGTPFKPPLPNKLAYSSQTRSI
jgi:hypothetical protein